MSPPAIEDHAAIGDGRSVALVSRGGSVDWLCWPRFESPALFAALLAPADGGVFRVAPAAPARPTWRYLPDSNVLETRWHTPAGRLVVTDLMPITADAREPAPEHELLRLARCEAGEVEVEVVFAPRPGFGADRPRWRDAGPLGVRVSFGRALLTLRSTRPLTLRDGGAVGRFRLRAGDTLDLSLSYSLEAPAVLPPLEEPARARLEATLAHWRAWAARVRYDGPFRAAVVRSALTLALLRYAPSGAVVAAATTSLPERLGGDLNWDYRFCWLRDAAFTARALHRLGLADDARGFVGWCLHATRLTRPELRVLYDVHGRAPRPERRLEHLPGYRGSRPVRIGNAAADQHQLDVYGELVAAVLELVGHSREHLDAETCRMLVDFGTFVCRHWDQPDDGIWELRAPPRHYTHSKLLAWKALDGLIALHAQRALPRLPGDRFVKNRDLLRRELLERAWSPRQGAYVQAYGDERLDAAALLFAWYGFHPASHPRIRATVRALVRGLSCGPGLLYRYEQSRDAGEGAFGICSFWLADVLARGAGTLAQARAAFTDALAWSNDLGLFSEEVDPATGAALGNFPQAYTHVGLINAALSLAARERAHVRHGKGAPPPHLHGGPP